jgi:pimeloyl-ACP methyl ester carboxylesterase
MIPSSVPSRRVLAALGVTAVMILTPPAQSARATGTAATAPAWQSCAAVIGVPLDPAVADCARMVVPLDHSGGQPGTTEVVMLRRRATDTVHRIGSLFVNPGGPGVSGLHLAYRAERLLAPEVVSRYDVIGFDPRGVGQSAPLKCFQDQERYEAAVAGRVLAPVSRAEITATVRAARHITAACADNAGPLLGKVSTASVARDLDLMRQAVGEEHLNFVGLSYGTLIGATYLNMFPSRVGAMVLDANVDPSLRMRDGLEYDRQRTHGFEAALGAFLDRCAAEPACAFRDGDPHARMAQLRTWLRRGPITLADGSKVTFSTFVGGLADGLAVTAELPDLARSLADLWAAGPGGGDHPVTRQVRGAGRFSAPSGRTAEAADQAGTPYRLDDSELAVNCLDKPYPRSAVWSKLADRWEHTAPTFGRMVAFEGVPCATWPVPWWTAARYTGPWDRAAARRPLVIGNLHDPVTQFAFSRRMARQLDGATLVGVDLIGHTALGLNRCADAATTGYLVDGRLPRSGTMCPADGPVFPGPAN